MKSTPASDGVWRRLVARPLWERKAAGSNPATPTEHRTLPVQPWVDLDPVRLEHPEPDLAHGGVRRDRVPERAQGHLGDDRHRRHVHELGDILADQGRADEDASLLVDDCPQLALVPL